MAPVGRGGVGRTSFRFAGVAVGVTCSDGGRRALLVDVSGPESGSKCITTI